MGVAYKERYDGYKVLLVGKDGFGMEGMGGMQGGKSMTGNMADRQQMLEQCMDMMESMMQMMMDHMQSVPAMK